MNRCRRFAVAGVVVLAGFAAACYCPERKINLVLASEDPQIVHLADDGSGGVKVTLRGHPAQIYYYGPNEPIQSGAPAEVRWIVEPDEQDPPDFDQVVIKEKATTSPSSKNLLGTVVIPEHVSSGKSGRVRRKPDNPEETWRYDILVKRKGDTVGSLDPDIIIIKDKPLR